ncbi:MULTISPECIES: tetratricopeptide repeat protein [unclassified Arcicella]|uniref:tetratricopeptide repeat protein n=1 Tax=unclassified Arcicella TaxID=2644986 RepID=UPI0028638A13|nr:MULTISPECIES: tetratricopeptide repeat protein [unclassified Arcicella]MDR6562621.1 tetratricopeptide (TPR) repeat protein [Arcicella sp. BE51]MDR6812708.1 tetratricopeptide (TPR) repeat protein [Arcicella sp. BE140]MDR6824020.1 tetratricopeptide (TPR) repeat protein [Arcicella sp. BE139]
MSFNRLALLKQFLEEEPENPFNHYALATELLKSDATEAGNIYLFLLKNHPDYLPTYYHAGALFSEFGETNLAEKIYTDGIALAQKVGNEKALKELKGAYQLFLDELEM